MKKGIKTATSSLYSEYGDEPLPEVGEYSVILDDKNNAQCIIKTTKVYIVPFTEVTEAHAFLEGEGDRKLKTWRSIHRSFFTKYLKRKGKNFQENVLVVCEEFQMVY